MRLLTSGALASAAARVLIMPAAFALTALPAAAHTQGYQGHYGGHMWDGGWHVWFFGPLMMVFWLAILVGVVVLVLRLLGIIGPGSKPRARPGSDALDVLRERFARGEIDKAEFEERRTLLEGSNQR